MCFFIISKISLQDFEIQFDYLMKVIIILFDYLIYFVLNFHAVSKQVYENIKEPIYHRQFLCFRFIKFFDLILFHFMNF